MATNPIQQLVDSGMQFTEMQRQQAEKLVGQWVSAGEVRRADAERTVQTLVDWGKQTTSQITSIVQREISKQLAWLADRVDDVEDQMEGLVSRVSGSPAKAPAPSAP